MADGNRTAIIAAATSLFVQQRYDRTSLAQVAARAGVSKATLFKQFPTKDLLFEATIVSLGGTMDIELPVPPSGDLHGGLTTLGSAYADVLTHPRTADLIRLLIGEGPRVDELRVRTFDFGAVPAIDVQRAYLRDERDAGHLTSADVDVDLAAEQFLGMIASAIFWPRLVHPTWSIDARGVRRAVDEAALTVVARYGPRR